MTDFEQLYAEHYGFVRRYLMKFCGDPPLAEELAQETFFKAYMNLNQLRDKDKAATWLCAIAKNAYFAWVNEQKHHATLNEDLANNAPDLSERLIDRELSHEAMLALHMLEEPYKEVFMLSVFADLPLKEISVLFGKSESWARVTFYRAKKMIRERLKET